MKTIFISSLALIAATPALAEDAAQRSDDIIVVGQGNAPVTLGKIDQTIRELPQSVTVVSREQINLTAANTLDDILLQTPGLTITGANEGSYYARGFQIDQLQFDGVATSIYAAASSPPDTALYDRVEVLRGAAGLWQGAGSFGGAINLVRKRALASGGYGRATLDTEGGYRVEGDDSTALDGAGAVRARLVGVYEDSDSFVDYVGGKKGVIYGALDFDLAPTTSLSLAASYQDVDDRPFPDYLPRYSNGTVLPVPRSTFLGAAWNRRSVETKQFFAELTQGLGGDWKARIAANILKSDRDSKTLQASGAVNLTTNRTNALVAANRLSTDQTSLDATVSGSFNLFGRSHELQFGANWRDLDNSLVNGSRSTPGAINVLSFDPAAFPEPAVAADQGLETTHSKQYGAFAALRLAPADGVKLILGGRASWFETVYDFKYLPFPGLIDDHQEYRVKGEITPYAGLTWDISDILTVYASYAEAFQPQNARKRDGSFIEPLTGQNYELGAKAAFAGGRLLASTTLFRVDQVNRAQEDPAFSCAQAAAATPPLTGRCFIAAGEVRSQGVEAEISGRLTPDWLIVGGYTYTDTEYRRDRTQANGPTAAEGTRFSSFTPKHILRVWTNYRLTGLLDGASIGGSVSYQSRWKQSNTAVYSQAPYAVVGLYAGYDVTPALTVSVNLNNLFDKTYFTSISSTSFGNRYGTPRSAIFTVRGRF